METAKVDIRKLQILNDRINQTLEALQQVRLSVHGIQHSAFAQQPFWGVQNPYAQQLNPYAQQQLNPFAQQFAQQQLNPFAQIPMGLGWQQPFGIGHTSADERFADPTLPYRMASAFPYAYAAIPPVVTLY